MGFAERREDIRASGQYDTTRGGDRISINRQPRESLRPWVMHVHGMELEQPADTRISCGIFADTAMLRVLLRGMWHAEAADGLHLLREKVFLFGPQSKRMPAGVRGSFSNLGLALRPGASHVLGGPSMQDLVDGIVSYESLGWNVEALIERFDAGSSVEEWMETLEDCMEQLVQQAGSVEPDPVTAGFHHLSLRDPSITVKHAAEVLGVDKRKLERIVKRDFGLSPKQVLLRARALDMAAHLRGVADKDEAQDLALRYFDQSHLTRDFTTMFGMTPMQFVRTPQPFLTITLEARQARRLEELDRLPPGGKRPWQ